MLCRTWLVSCLAAARENLPSPQAYRVGSIGFRSFPSRQTAFFLAAISPTLSFAQTPTLVSIAVTSANRSIPGQLEQLMWQPSGSANLSWGRQQQRAARRCVSYQERSI
jgi:hypothetical protein